jgi:transposase
MRRETGGPSNEPDDVIERSFDDHRQWRGIATRYDKLATVHRGAVALRAITM